MGSRAVRALRSVVGRAVSGVALATRKPRRLAVSAGALVAVLGVSFTLAMTGAFQLMAAPIAIGFSVKITSPGQPGASTITDKIVNVTGFTCTAVGHNRYCSSGNPDRVDLHVNGDLVASRVVNLDGTFEFGHIALRPGKNTLEVTANRIYGWRPLRASDGIDVYVEPTAPAVPTLAPLSPIVGSSSIRVRGSADPHVAVIVRAESRDRAPDGSESASAPVVTALAHTDPRTGQFAATLDLYPPGAYSVSALAVNSFDARSRPSKHVALTYDPAYVPPGQSPVRRRLDVTLAANHIHSRFDVALPRDDVRGRRLFEGDITAQAFFEQVFGPLNVTNVELAGLFQGVQPVERLSGDSLRVTADSNPELEGTTLTGSFSLTVKEGTYLSGPNDSFHLHFMDYHVLSLDPEPAVYSDADATWTGPLELTDPSITARLAFDPAASPVTAVRLRPYDVIPWPASAPIGLLYAIMNSIALVWYLWLRRRHAGSQWLDGGTGERLDRLARWLIGFCFVPATMDMARAIPAYAAKAAPLASLIPDWARKLVGEDVRLSLAVLLIADLVAIAATMALHRRTRRAVTFWLSELVRGIAVALSVTAILFVLLVVWYDQPLYIDYRAVAWLFIAPIAVVLGVSTTRIALAVYERGSQPSSRPLWRRVAIPLVAVLVAGVSFPVATSAYRVGTDLGGYADVAIVASSVFLVVQFDAALVVLIAAVDALSRPADEVDEPLERALGRLIFVNLIVSVDPYLFGIPLSFGLSLLLFGRLFLPPRARAQLAEVADTVRASRSDDLARLQVDFAVDKVGAYIERLHQQVDAGELSHAEASRKAREARRGMVKREQEKEVTPGLPTRKAVLMFGPRETNWANGKFAAGWGFLIALPWLVLYFSTFAFRAGEVSTPIIPLVVVNNLLTQPLFWVVQAFFFGYFFTSIRGDSGLQKGFWMAFIVGICQLPEWLTSFRTAPEAVSTLLGALVELLSFPLLGLVFDYRTVSEGLGGGFAWSTLARLTGAGGLTAFASLIVASVGVALTSVVSGEFASLIGLLLRVAGAPTPTAPGH